MDNFGVLAPVIPVDHAESQQILLYGIDQGFLPDNSDNTVHMEQNMLKKLQPGDTMWETTKKICGWIVGTLKLSISVPSSQLEKVQTVFNLVPTNKFYTSARQWHRLLGVLFYIVPTISGIKGMFSTSSLSSGATSASNSPRSSR